MRHQRQMELLDRVAEAGRRMTGLQGEESFINKAEAYTSQERFEAEQRILFRDGPVFFCLSGDLGDPGDYRTGVFGGVSVLVIRQPDLTLRAMVNACRHRGSPLVEPGSAGTGLSTLSCPYHAWTYELDGKLRVRPAAEGAFDDVSMDCNLHEVTVAEQHGLVFVRAGGGGDPIDIEQTLGGMQTDLVDFRLQDETLVESRVHTWNLNWKLVMDTFMEAYHIRTLHRDTIGPYFNSDCMIFEPFGYNLAAIAFRKNILEEMEKPRSDRSILPYATIQYFAVPNALLSYQLDHWEVWRLEPLDRQTTRTTTSVYSQDRVVTDRDRAHLTKNLDLLLEVTGSEDFPMMERIQANLQSGALPEIVFGRNESALTHFHKSLNERLER